MKVVVLHGNVPPDAPADEQDVLVEAAHISQALAAMGHRTSTVALSLDFEQRSRVLRQATPDLVFNIVESVEGRGQLIHLGPTLLEHLRIPYTGAPLEAIFTTSNKLAAKERMAACRVPTPRWVELGATRRAMTRLRAPVIVKALWEHASIGLDGDALVHDLAILPAVMTRRTPLLGGHCFAEEYIDGREFNLSMLAGRRGPQVLPVAEIRFESFAPGQPKLVDYRAKWDENSFEYQHTVRSFEFPKSDDALLERLRRVAKRCWQLFHLRGYARVDFRVDAVGQPYVLEVNTNPCISPDAGFIAAATRAGLTSDQVMQRIIDDVPGAKERR